MALLEARRHGADEALLLDTQGHVSEASASNVFLVSSGVIVTPPLTCGVLPGITRAVVLELLAERGLHAFERPVDVSELATVDEVFCTSSLRGVAPVTRIAGRDLGPPGPITRAMMDAYAARVLQECVR
jgi:branched-chain amino acid aminotransferase